MQAMLARQPRDALTLDDLVEVLAQEPWGGPVQLIRCYMSCISPPITLGCLGAGPPPEPAGGEESEEERRYRLTIAPRPPIMFVLITRKNQGNGLYLVRHQNPYSELLRCDDCGVVYRHCHTCNQNRASFYYHQIKPSKDWWVPVRFRPIGTPPNTIQLFITYDIETYTRHGGRGKELQPYLLVFRLDGHGSLLHPVAQALATDPQLKKDWTYYPEAVGAGLTYYRLDSQPMSIGTKFRHFRGTIQQLLVQKFWDEVVRRQSPKLASMEDDGHDFTFEELQADSEAYRRELHEQRLRAKRLRQDHVLLGEDACLRLEEDEGRSVRQPLMQGEPQFWEVYVIGHNISGFDEIVMAASIIDNRATVQPAFNVSRTFMPRQGKVLFNDIRYSVPNPAFHLRSDFAEWEQGIERSSDRSFQGVTFMVRDTFQLTHTSLRKAAEAYNLSLDKGHCPYEAVNEHFRLGTYERDDIGFPAPKYWADEQEHREAREEYAQRCPGLAYNIEQEALRYCVLDVQVTAELVSKLQESYRNFVIQHVGLDPRCNFNVLSRATISSNSHAIFRQVWYRETHCGRSTFHAHLLAPSRQMYDYVRLSIRGGRCYPTYLGVLEEPLYVYDICGMYASALTHPFPTGFPLAGPGLQMALDRWRRRLGRREPISYFDPDLLPGIVSIDADAPDPTQLDVLPPFSSRRGGRLAWTNEDLRGEVATTVDIVTLHNRGWTVRILDDARSTIFPQSACVARSYVTLNIQAKEQADRDKNQTMRSIAKLLSNALYGSFATKLDNRRTLFAADFDGEYGDDFERGDVSIIGATFLVPDTMSEEVLPQFKHNYYSPVKVTNVTHWSNGALSYCYDGTLPPENAGLPRPPPPYIPRVRDPPIPRTDYKPMAFFPADPDDITILTVEKQTELIENNRYPTHIASFVLAWTRAFVSEWANFLYESDRGLRLEQRLLKSVYGDTDSLFLTAEGRRWMESKGRHRIKKNKLGGLVFDPAKPALTWLVECETVCPVCGADAYSPRTVFLAPKIYALEQVICTADPSHVGKGKLRAKGHATSSLSFEVLESCYRLHNLEEDPDAHFETTRVALKRNLVSLQSKAVPFSVLETRLTRTLRPWKDRTLVPLTPGDPNNLVPYSNADPNPRLSELTLMPNELVNEAPRNELPIPPIPPTCSSILWPSDI